MLGFSLPFYKSPTLLLSLGLSIRVLWYLLTRRPDVIHVSSPGLLVFSAIVYAKLLAIPLVVSYHTHIPEYIPMYTWTGFVEPMWTVIRYCTLVADLTLVPSKAMKVTASCHLLCCCFVLRSYTHLCVLITVVQAQSGIHICPILRHASCSCAWLLKSSHWARMYALSSCCTSIRCMRAASTLHSLLLCISLTCLHPQQHVTDCFKGCASRLCTSYAMCLLRLHCK